MSAPDNVFDSDSDAILVENSSSYIGEYPSDELLIFGGVIGNVRSLMTQPKASKSGLLPMKTTSRFGGNLKPLSL